MSQYTIGTVDVVNGSANVAGVSTAWLASIAAGEIFTVSGSTTWYQIANVVSDTQLTLSAPYGGVTASGVNYTITRDFAPNRAYPLLNAQDVEASKVASRAIVMIDQDVGNLISGATLDARYVKKSGDSLTGNLGIGAPPGYIFDIQSDSNHVFSTPNNVNARVAVGSPNNVSHVNAADLQITAQTGSGICGMTFNVGDATNCGNIYWRSDTSSNTLQIVGNPGNNFIAFYTSATEKVRIDSSGNVKIGATSLVGARLIVGGAVAAAGVATDIIGNAVVLDFANGGRLFTQDASPLSFLTNSSPRVTIDPSGNVGIGTVSPNAKLEVESESGTTGIRIQDMKGSGGSSASVAEIHFGVNDGSHNIGESDTAKIRVGADATANGYIDFTAYPSNNGGAPPSTNSIMRILGSGNVGIGTTSPAAKLDVYGAVYIRSGSNLLLYDSANTAAAVINSPATNQLGFQTGGTERIRIDPGGHVLVGVTGLTGDSFADDLVLRDVSGGTTPGMTFDVNGHSGTSQGAIQWRSDLSSQAGKFYFDATNNFFAFNIAGAERARIDSAGNVGIGAIPQSAAKLLVSSSSSGVANLGNPIGIGQQAGLVVESVGQTGVQIAVPDAQVGNIFFSSPSQHTLANIFAGYGDGNPYLAVMVNGGVERMRITASGNLGISTGAPSATLSVNGNMSLECSQSNVTRGIYWYANADVQYGAVYRDAASGDLTIGANYAGINSELHFQTAGTNRMQIAGTGAVQINSVATNGTFSLQAQNGRHGVFAIHPDGSAYAGFFQQNGSSYAVQIHAASATFNHNVLVPSAAQSDASSYNLIYCWNSSGNRFIFRGDGNAYAHGTFNNNSLDYAEYFESEGGSEIPLGTSVVLVGDKIRPATASDDACMILGVVRPKGEDANSTVIGGAAWNEWSQKFLTDRFGRRVREEYKVVEWSEHEEVNTPDGHRSERLKQNHCYATDLVPAEITPPDSAVVRSNNADGTPLLRPKLNPSYDPSKAYVPRDDRPEWHVIGLMGQIPMLKGQPVGDRWIKMRDIGDEVEIWMIR